MKKYIQWLRNTDGTAKPYGEGAKMIVQLNKTLQKVYVRWSNQTHYKSRTENKNP